MLYARTGALNMAQMARVLSSGPLDSLVTAGLTFVIFGYLVKLPWFLSISGWRTPMPSLRPRFAFYFQA